MAVTLDGVTNFAKLTVVGTYDAVATVITVGSGQTGLLPAAPFNLTWWDSTLYFDPADDPNKEIVRCTIINSGSTITVTRGQEGTSATPKNNAGDTYLMILGITEKMITDIQSGLQKAVQYQNLSGTIDGVNRVFTFTPVYTDPNSPNVSLARQPQLLTIDYTLSISGSNGVVTYGTAPDGSLSGQPHVISYW